MEAATRHGPCVAEPVPPPAGGAMLPPLPSVCASAAVAEAAGVVGRAERKTPFFLVPFTWCLGPSNAWRGRDEVQLLPLAFPSGITAHGVGGAGTTESGCSFLPPSLASSFPCTSQPPPPPPHVPRGEPLSESPARAPQLRQCVAVITNLAGAARFVRALNINLAGSSQR